MGNLSNRFTGHVQKKTMFNTILADLRPPARARSSRRARMARRGAVLSRISRGTAHRFIHPLYRAGISILPRYLSQVSRFLTGIEIHPGAQLGNGVFIDHGMGVVIGETAQVGDGCTIYKA